MSKYSAVFKLWDVTAGARTGDLIEESEPETFDTLPALVQLWDAYAVECPVPLDPLSIPALRVSMSRNGGSAIARRRFSYEGRQYLVEAHVTGTPRVWSVVTPSGDRLTVKIVSKAPVIAAETESGAEELELSPVS